VTAVAGGAVAAAALYTVLARELPTITPIPRHRLRVVVLRALRLAAAAAREELVWRWLVLGLGSAVVGVPAAFAVATVGFAAAHWRQAGARSIAVHSVTGCVFGGLYLAGGVVTAIVAHALYNLLVLSAVEAHGGGARAP
jgi:hypothetical protein